jgi:hypothetical protein
LLPAILSFSRSTRAFATAHETLDALYRRVLADALHSAGRKAS